MTATSPRRIALGMAAGVGAHGILLVIANARNDLITNSYTARYVLFGGPTDFPGDFGRALFGGTVALGIVVLGVALVLWRLGGSKAGRVIGAASIAAGVLLAATYRASGNLLGARPPSAAVLAAAGLVLVSLPDRVVGSEP